MTEIQLAHFSFGGDSLEDSRFYEVAIREARTAADAHAVERAAPTHRRSLAQRLGVPARVRAFAFAGGTSTTVDGCVCAA